MKIEKDLNKDINDFGVFKIVGGELVPAPEITCKEDYEHGIFGLTIHHFIKDTHYKKNQYWYEENGIDQKLILMDWAMHEHLESPVYGLTPEKFYEVYGIEKDKLLFNKKAWIAKQCEC